MYVFLRKYYLVVGPLGKSRKAQKQVCTRGRYPKSLSTP